MSNFEIRVTGATEALQDLKRFQLDKPAEFKRGVVKFALLVQREAQKRTPVDTGALRNSAATRLTDNGLRGFYVDVSFMQFYAVFVHENLHAYHPVGEAKYLENAVRAMLPRLQSTVLSEVV